MDNKEFYSQLGEDKWIFENLDLPADGVFVDIGCNDPVNLNNTYAFEKYLGWKGVAVDVNFMFAPAWSKQRPNTDFFAGALTPDNSGLRLIEMYPLEQLNFEIVRRDNVPDGEKVKKCWVATIPVLTLLYSAFELNELERIDLLSIDVEGMEIELLESVFTHTKPRIIIAEHSTMWIEGKNTQLKELCESHGYATVHETALNYIFSL